LPIRKSYDGVVACLPVTIPYRRYSTNSAQWWLGRALHELVKRAGLRPKDIDGFAVSSFTIGPDTAVGLTQHFGLSPRWLEHIPLGGASGVVALRRAARAVQAGDATIVACVGADTNHVDSFRKTLSTFSRFAQDAVYPYGSGGANASFALITKHYMNMYGAKREDFGKLCIAQRYNALSIPYAMMKKKLTLEEYMAARVIHGKPLAIADTGISECPGWASLHYESIICIFHDSGYTRNCPFYYAKSMKTSVLNSSSVVNSFCSCLHRHVSETANFTLHFGMFGALQSLQKTYSFAPLCERKALAQGRKRVV